MADIDPKDLQNAVRDGVREGISDSGVGKSGPGLDTDKLANTLKTSFETAIQSLGGVLGVKLDALTKAPQAYMGVMGSSNPNDALNVAVANTIKILPEKLQGIADGIKYFVGVLNEIRSDSRAMGNIGVGQGNVPGMRYAAQQAGYPDINSAVEGLKGTDKTLKGVGQTYDQAAGRFFEFAKEVRQDPQIKMMLDRGIIRDEDIPRLAAIAAGGKTQMLDTEEGRRRLAQQTSALGTQIEQQVQAYGLDKDAVLKHQQTLNNSADEQLRNQALRNDAERQGLKEIEVKSQAQGESMQKIIAGLYAGQRLSKDQQIMLQMATGGRAGQLRSAVREMKRTSGLADDDPAKIAARERYERELANMNASQNKQRFAQIGLNTADPSVRGAIETLQKENQAKASQGKTQLDTGLSPANARQRQMAAGAQNIYGLKQESVLNPDGGKVRNEEAETLKLISTISQQARSNAVAATGAFADLNKELGKAPEKLKPIYNFFDYLLGPASQTAEEKKRAAYDPMLDILNGMLNPVKGSGNTSGVPRDRSENPTVNIPNSTVNLNNPSVVNVGPSGNTAPSGVNSDRSANPLLQRGTGTLGETGFPIELKDTIAQLHKGETVLTPGQLTNLINGSSSSMLNNITSTISSITGGGSTTRSLSQDSKSKEAEQKIENVRAQYEKDRADITSKIRENMGPDAKHSEVLKALKTNPAAKDLESQMRNTIASLTETVRVGTSVEQTGIVPSLTDAFKGFNNEPAEVEEVIAEEPKSQFEEIGAETISLKDVRDELIQLNTNIRQLIEHSADMADSATRQIRATESLSGNRFA